MTEKPTGTEPGQCPWCSSERGTDAGGRCLSCGAALIATDEVADVPGVTDVDTLGIIRQRTAKQPNRIVAWVTGDSPESEQWAPAGEALEQPSLDVRREMLRLEFDAAIAAQQAEVEALRAEQAVAAAEKSGQGSHVERAPDPTDDREEQVTSTSATVDDGHGGETADDGHGGEPADDGDRSSGSADTSEV
jgi:hypothetical protein